MAKEDKLETIEAGFEPFERPDIVVGRYERSGSKKDSGYFINIRDGGVVLIPINKKEKDLSQLALLAKQINGAKSFEHYDGNRDIKNLKEGWAITYKRLDFIEMAELEKMIRC